MRRLATIILLTCFGLSVFAEATFSIMPPRNVIAGERFQVVYRLTDGQGSSLKAPQINGCQLLYGPSTSSSYSTQIINGVATSSSSIDYTYIYKAEKEGSYTIPAASIIVDGKKLTADARNFNVLPSDRQSQQGANSGATLGDLSTQTPDRKITKDDIFVRIILNKSSAYEQEAIECTLKLYTKYEAITSFGQINPATYDGFLIDEVQQPSQLNAIENYNGQNYRTAILRKCIIFPQKTGKLTISSGTYDVTLQQMERVSNGYFYMTRPVEKNVKLSPFTATVNVKPLPEPRPAGFNGAVGTFTIDSDLSSSSLRTGEAASLTFTVKGTGNIKYLKLPEVEFPSEFEQYTPKQEYDTRISGSTVTGTMTAEYTFVPESVGKFNIPSTNFVYFNPASGKYTTLTTPSREIKVSKGVGSSSSNVDQKDITLKNNDILHIRLGDKNLSHSHVLMAQTWWYWLIYPLMLFIFIIIVIVAGKRIKANADIVGRRASRANKVAKKRLALAEKEMKAGNREAFYEATLKALWGYLSDKLSIPASELTRSNIADELIKYGVSQSVTGSLISLLDECEMARYTPDTSAKTPEEIYKESAEIINQMQTIKR